MTIQPFAFEGVEVRVVADEQGDPWFIAADVARILGYRMASDMTRRLDDDDRGTRSMRTPSGDQEMTVISEAGLYVAVLGSHVAGARDFKRWVTREVLPAIRKHGGYLTPEMAREVLTDPRTLIRLATDLIAEQERNAALTIENTTQRAVLAIATPKAEAFDRWLSSNVDYSADQVGKALSALGAATGRNRLLEKMGIAKDDGGFGMIYRVGKFWHPYQSEVEIGRLRVKLGRYEDSKTGAEHQTATVRITPKRATYLAVKYGVLPAAVAEHLDGEVAA